MSPSLARQPRRLEPFASAQSLPDHILLRCFAAIPFPLYRNVRAVCSAWKRLADPTTLHNIRLDIAQPWRFELENAYVDGCFVGLGGRALPETQVTSASGAQAGSGANAPPPPAPRDAPSPSDSDPVPPEPPEQIAAPPEPIAVPPMAIALLSTPLRIQFGVVALPHSPLLLVLGGRSPFSIFTCQSVCAYACVDAYNAPPAATRRATRRQAQLKHMCAPRFAFAVAACTHPGTGKTYVAVAGGYAVSGESLRSAELYCVSSDRWVVLPTLKSASGACRAAMVGTRLLVAQRSGGPAESINLVRYITVHVESDAAGRGSVGVDAVKNDKLNGGGSNITSSSCNPTSRNRSSSSSSSDDSIVSKCGDCQDAKGSDGGDSWWRSEVLGESQPDQQAGGQQQGGGSGAANQEADKTSSKGAEGNTENQSALVLQRPVAPSPSGWDSVQLWL